MDDPTAELISLDDVRTLAERRLDSMAFAYYAGGAGAEETLRDNEQAFRSVGLVQRALVDVSGRRLETTLLGSPVGMPIAVAPTAFHGLAHPEGEKATARAAGAEGVLMTVSTLSTTPLEDVAGAAGGPLWFQLYVYRDREVTRDLIRRAEAAGYRALVLTVDTAVAGRREREMRTGFTLPAHLNVANLLPYARGESTRATSGASGFMNYVAELLDPGLDWSIIEWLRQVTALPIVLKGIQTAADARRAVAAGVDAIWVSNHGGRQLDGSPGTLRLLPDLVAAVAGAVEIYLDGGVRRGADALKALALGARAVFVGRPILWGLAVAGEAGVRRVLRILREELDTAMALTGSLDPGAVSDEILYRR